MLRFYLRVLRVLLLLLLLLLFLIVPVPVLVLVLVRLVLVLLRLVLLSSRKSYSLDRTGECIVRLRLNARFALNTGVAPRSDGDGADPRFKQHAQSEHGGWDALECPKQHLEQVIV